jgi:hypothetical protein
MCRGHVVKGPHRELLSVRDSEVLLNSNGNCLMPSLPPKKSEARDLRSRPPHPNRFYAEVVENNFEPLGRHARHTRKSWNGSLRVQPQRMGKFNAGTSQISAASLCSHMAYSHAPPATRTQKPTNMIIELHKTTFFPFSSCLTS